MIIKLTRNNQLIVGQEIIECPLMYAKSILIYEFVVRATLYESESIAVSFADDIQKTYAIPLQIRYYNDNDFGNNTQIEYYTLIPNVIMNSPGAKTASVMILDDYSADEPTKKRVITTADIQFTVQANNAEAGFEPIDADEAEILQEQINGNKINIETNKGNIDKVQAQAEEIRKFADELNTRINDNQEMLQSQKEEIQGNISNINNLYSVIKEDLIDFSYNEEIGEATKIYRNGERETFPLGSSGGIGGGLGFEIINFNMESWKQLENSSWQLHIPSSQTGFSDSDFVVIMEIWDDSKNTYYKSAEEFLRESDGSLTVTNDKSPYAGRFILPISKRAMGVVTVDTIHSLPNVGNKYAVYVVKRDNKSYRYDDIDNKYYCISGTDWKEILVIDGNMHD